MDFFEVIKSAVNQGASDIFMIPGCPISIKVKGQIEQMETEAVYAKDTEILVKEIYEQAGRKMDQVLETGDDDFSFSLPDVSRFRVNVFKQRNSLASVIRVVSFDLPEYHDIGIPQEIIDIAKKHKGLVLVTGPAGTGKSTTLACIINEINNTRNSHIITIEDPIEFIHRHKRSIVTQREIALDTENYATALRASLRQAPDVVLLGEMRDFETISTALTAAETGHLVISTLHTVGAAKSIDRIIDAFSPEQQHQIRLQLSMVLETVVSQQLVPTTSDGLIPVFEIMNANSAIRNLIREGKTHQLNSIIQTSQNAGMITMDQYLQKLYRQNIISKDTAVEYAMTPEFFERGIL